MPEVVEANMTQSSSLEGVLKAGANVVVSLSLSVAEHIGTAYESGVLSENFVKQVVHRDGSGLVVLGMLSASDGNKPFLEVYIFPPKIKQFPPAHPGTRGCEYDRIEMGRVFGQKSVDLLFVEVPGFWWLVFEGFDSLRRILFEVAPLLS